MSNYSHFSKFFLCSLLSLNSCGHFLDSTSNQIESAVHRIEYSILQVYENTDREYGKNRSERVDYFNDFIKKFRAESHDLNDIKGKTSYEKNQFILSAISKTCINLLEMRISVRNRQIDMNVEIENYEKYKRRWYGNGSRIFKNLANEAVPKIRKSEREFDEASEELEFLERYLLKKCMEYNEWALKEDLESVFDIKRIKRAIDSDNLKPKIEFRDNSTNQYEYL